MTMAEFVILALNDELHPKYQEKEENNMANMRTLAFQVPEDLFQRIKDYLRRNNMTQKEFIIGLIESEIERPPLTIVKNRIMRISDRITFTSNKSKSSNATSIAAPK